MKKILFLLIIAAAAIVSCSKLNDPTTKHDRLKAILLGKDTLQMYVGENRQLPLTLSPSDYNTDSLKWSSSDSTVLKISNIGLLSALKTGTAKITVSNLENTISVSALVTVNPAPIDSLKIGLIAYYPFTNGAADSSGNKFNGFVNGAKLTTDRNGHANSAYLFDGVSSNIVVKDAPVLRLSNTDFTVNSWVVIKKYDPSYGSITITKRGYGSQNGWNFGIAGYGDLTNSIGAVGVITFDVSAGDDPVAIGNAQVDTAAWHMLTTVYNVSKHETTIYVDGKFDTVTENIPSPNSQTTDNMFIGSDNPNLGDSYLWNGKIDDIRIYNRALKASEVGKLFLRTN
jgi:hypothetical protein